MPYILLLLGLLVGAYSLYRFFLQANVAQIKALLFSLITIVIGIALFFMALTGRLPAAIALVAALLPFIAGILKARHSARKTDVNTVEAMTEKEAFEILGLNEDANTDDIKAAYKKLMKKLHPDQDGSDWMAAKLNAAKDLLLK